jgi:hypothetical protein
VGIYGSFQACQFYLRHRDDIREWASIEREVVAATREMLGGLQPEIGERISAFDATAETVRLDGGRYERILVRRPDWPVGVGVTLEWESNVDPFGGSMPKWGIFFVNADPALLPARQVPGMVAGSGCVACADRGCNGGPVAAGRADD